MPNQDKNLHLEFRFVDRAGRDVFEVFRAADNKTLRTPLGSVTVPTMAGDSLTAIASITYACPEAFDESISEQLELPLTEGE